MVMVGIFISGVDSSGISKTEETPNRIRLTRQIKTQTGRLTEKSGRENIIEPPSVHWGQSGLRHRLPDWFPGLFPPSPSGVSAAEDSAIRCDTHSPILEVRQIARNLNAMVEELGTVETLREDFIAGVSHELKTPLTAIEGYAVLLGEPDITAAEQRQYTQEILDSSRRLSRMVSSILHLSSLDHCSELPGCREFSLDEQLRQCLLELEPHWTRKHLELDLELPEVRCTGSEELCRQIWQNLYSNAIKFTPDGGTITTRITTEPGWVTVSISDTGIGMPGEVQKHIFEKFYQGDASHSTNGTGLGLALAKRITDLHGGSISVRSAPGEGSCFSVRLPVQPASRRLCAKSGQS